MDEKESNLDLGLMYAGGDNYDKAIEYLTLAIQEEIDLEDEIEARSWRSTSYGQSGMVKEALTDANWLISHGETQKFRWRAHLKERLKDYQGAIEDYSHVIEVDQPPISFELYLKRGQMYFHTEQFAKAVDDFTVALSLVDYPSLAETIHIWRGKANVELEHYQAGLDDFQNAIDLVGFEPHDKFWFCYHRGLARENLGDVEGAIKDYRFAIIPADHSQAERVNKLLDSLK